HERHLLIVPAHPEQIADDAAATGAAGLELVSVRGPDDPEHLPPTESVDDDRSWRIRLSHRGGQTDRNLADAHRLVVEEPERRKLWIGVWSRRSYRYFDPPLADVDLHVEVRSRLVVGTAAGAEQQIISRWRDGPAGDGCRE